MSDPRIVFAQHGLGSVILEPRFTIQVSDETSFGVWSRPNRRILIFSDNYLDGTLTNSDGRIAGALGGHPLQLRSGVIGGTVPARRSAAWSRSGQRRCSSPG